MIWLGMQKRLVNFMHNSVHQGTQLRSYVPACWLPCPLQDFTTLQVLANMVEDTAFTSFYSLHSLGSLLVTETDVVEE